MDIPTPLQEALRDSITSGTFIDTKFWVFSKRSSESGRVGEPKALFVNERVVRSVPRLGALLDHAETKVNLRTQFPTDCKPYTSDYDYEADSDLEEDEDWDYPNVADATRPVSENSKGKGGKSDSKGSASSGSTKAKAKAAAATSASTHIGAVLVVKDAAFVTFQALLRYLYTNEIEFALWGSADRRRARAREDTSEPYDSPKPSPKSIYRLADKYDIPRLKELALRQIKHDICCCKCDIVEEVFSKFTSRYPELREFELENLARTLLSTDSSSTMDALKEKIKAYTLGQLLHAEDVLPTLYELMGKGVPLEETPTQPPVLSTAGHDWEELKDALTLSLTSGSFLDSQFYAPDSKPLSPATPTIRPIYFCSMVGETSMSRITKYSSRIWPSGKTRFHYVDDYESDVDDKGSSVGIPIETYPRSTCIPEDPLPTYEAPAPALVLKSGTARTWSAIFFYLYTSNVEFAPLSSRGIKKTASVENKTPDKAISTLQNHDQTPGAANASPPTIVITEACSPKSIYALASKIDLPRLRDLAFDNIRSQLDEKNIIQELLSPFTADHEPVRQMQQQLLFANFRSSAQGDSFLEIIRDSSSGKHSHRAAAMEQIFEKMVHDCRERVVAQEEKLLQQDRKKKKHTAALATQSTATNPPPLTPESDPVVQPSQPSQTEQGHHMVEPSSSLFTFPAPPTWSNTKPQSQTASLFRPTSKPMTQQQPQISSFSLSTPKPTKQPQPPQSRSLFEFAPKSAVQAQSSGSFGAPSKSTQLITNHPHLTTSSSISVHPFSRPQFLRLVE